MIKIMEYAKDYSHLKYLEGRLDSLESSKDKTEGMICSDNFLAALKRYQKKTPLWFRQRFDN